MPLQKRIVMTMADSVVNQVLSNQQNAPITGKVLKSDQSGAQAFISIDPSGINICANPTTGMRYDIDGLKLLGELSVNGGFSNVVVGGLWTMNPTLMTYVPSTAVTPIPAFIPNNPLGAVVQFANKLRALTGM